MSFLARNPMSRNPKYWNPMSQHQIYYNFIVEKSNRTNVDFWFDPICFLNCYETICLVKSHSQDAAATMPASSILPNASSVPLNEQTQGPHEMISIHKNNTILPNEMAASSSLLSKLLLTYSQLPLVKVQGLGLCAHYCATIALNGLDFTMGSIHVTPCHFLL